MWQYFQSNPCGLSTGDCTVRAISKALDISWDKAHDILSEFAKNMCDMPHKDWVWGAVLRAKGLTGAVQYSRATGSTDTADAWEVILCQNGM